MKLPEECPVCGYPNVQAVDCEHEPVDCIFCPRCGWSTDLELVSDEPEKD